MQRERVTDRIFVFRSELYAQVTAGVVRTSAGAVLIDTLLFPDESRQIRDFVESALGSRVRYLINTHFHADHSTGSCFFPGAQIVAHRRCRELLDTRGREGLRRLQESSADFADVALALPDIVFEEQISLHVGGTTFTLWASPGHSPDSIVCHVEDANVLFAADTVMPIPYFVDGDHRAFKRSLRRLRAGSYENIVQGHGDIILRGEAAEKLESDIAYLDALERLVTRELENGGDPRHHVSAEDCGKSHVLLNGLAPALHEQNVLRLVERQRDLAASGGG